MEFFEPWQRCADSRFVDELRREMPPGHALQNSDVTIVARRNDRDDFLYSINDGTGRMAEVHLTWSKSSETNQVSPRTMIYENIESWLETMRAAHNERG